MTSSKVCRVFECQLMARVVDDGLTRSWDVRRARFAERSDESGRSCCKSNLDGEVRGAMKRRSEC